MPQYTYVCKDCSYKEELIQSIKEGDEYQRNTPVCPKCESETWQRIIGRTSFKLNGYGWFRDGY